MTLADIARLAGVSRTTASYVINGQAEQRRISSATIDKVMAVVRQHRYHIDPQAAALRHLHSKAAPALAYSESETRAGFRKPYPGTGGGKGQ